MNNRVPITEIVDALAKRQNITKKKAETFARAFFDTIREGLSEEKFVKITGFGTFKVVTVEERESVNIRTGERFTIESHDKISFTPDTQLKELVNRPFAHFQTTVLNDETSDVELEAVNAKVAAAEIAAAPAAIASLADLPKEPKAEAKPQPEPAPKAEEPKAEPIAPKTEAPKEEPKPVVEEPKPVVEEPKPIVEETPKQEEPKAEPIAPKEEEVPAKKRSKKWFWIGILIGALLALAVKYTFFSNKDEAQTDATEQVAEEPAPQAAPEPAKPVGNYTLVLCNGVDENGAKYYADQLKKSGVDAEIQKGAKYHRVIFGRFETEQAAYQKRAEMQQTVKEFKQCYVDKVE